MGRAGRSKGSGGSSAGGSSSGGSRGFGSGGNRSFGGRSSSGSPGSSSAGRGNSSSGQGGGFGGFPPQGMNSGRNAAGQSFGGDIFGLGGANIPHTQQPRGYQMPPVNMGGIMGGGNMNNRVGGGFFRGGSSPVGCLVVPIVLIIVLVVTMALFSQSPVSSGSSGDSAITQSTVKREPLPKGAVNETEYYTDTLGWITNPGTLTTGMRDFYDKTGVQPYLYITDNIGGTNYPNENQVEQFMYNLYDELFTDEAHLLVVFFEYGGTYHTWYLNGVQAKTVLDDEAMNILLDHIDKYYYYDIKEDEMFSKAFSDAAEKIMTVETSPWIPVLVVVGVLAIFLVIFIWWRNAKKQKNLEAEQTQKILDTPLQTYASGTADDLAGKYSDIKTPVSEVGETFADSEVQNLAEKYKDDKQ